MPQFGHGASLDLPDPLTRQVEVLTDLFESSRLASVEAKSEPQDLSLSLIERRQEPLDLFGEQRNGSDLEG
jgi:uncharacterized protein (UPF0262 family)